MGIISPDGNHCALHRTTGTLRFMCMWCVHLRIPDKLYARDLHLKCLHEQVIEIRKMGRYNKIRNSGDCDPLRSTRATLCFKYDGSRGCAQIRGPAEMASLFITHATGIWVHYDKGHKMCGLPMNRYPTRVLPCISTWLLGRTDSLRLCRPQPWRQKVWEWA